jgi:hypothetical protein
VFSAELSLSDIDSRLLSLVASVYILYRILYESFSMSHKNR